MQALPLLSLQLFQRLETDLEMLADALPIEFVGHAGKLDLTMKRLVRNAQQCAVRHAKAEAVGSDRCRFHVERNCTRLRQAADDGGAGPSVRQAVLVRDG